MRKSCLGMNFFRPGGQGVIAIQMRSDDEKTKEIVDPINDMRDVSLFAGGA